MLYESMDTFRRPCSYPALEIDRFLLPLFTLPKKLWPNTFLFALKSSTVLCFQLKHATSFSSSFSSFHHYFIIISLLRLFFLFDCRFLLTYSWPLRVKKFVSSHSSISYFKFGITSFLFNQIIFLNPVVNRINFLGRFHTSYFGNF